MLANVSLPLCDDTKCWQDIFCGFSLLMKKVTANSEAADRGFLFLPFFCRSLICFLIKQKIPQYEINWTFGKDWESLLIGFWWENRAEQLPPPPANWPSLLFSGQRLCACFLARLFFPLCSAINRLSHDRHVWFMWGCWMGIRRQRGQCIYCSVFRTLQGGEKQ